MSWILLSSRGASFPFVFYFYREFRFYGLNNLDFVVTSVARYRLISTMDQVIQMLPEPLKQISTHHDFAGQKRAERIYQVIIIVAGVLGFFIGFVGQQLSYTVYTVASGFVVACAVVLPPWSCFRQNPVMWQPVKKDKDENPSASTGQSKNNKKKNK